MRWICLLIKVRWGVNFQGLGLTIESKDEKNHSCYSFYRLLKYLIDLLFDPSFELDLSEIDHFVVLQFQNTCSNLITVFPKIVSALE